MWAKLKHSPEDVKEKTRVGFINSMLPILQKSTDEDAAFLLEIYNAVQESKESRTGRNSSIEKNEINSVSVNSSAKFLVGKWERTTGMGSIGDGTGKTKYGNGTTFSFEFFPDGTVEYIKAEKTLSIMGCKIESTDRGSGTFTTNGGSMKIDFAAMSSVGTDSCDRAGNYKKSLPPGDVNVSWKVKQSDSVFRPDKPLLLCFEGSGGEVCYEKVN
jgi:hypothetical protein